jgi:exoribonuclease R
MSSTTYKINIDNRNYANWTIYNAVTLDPVKNSEMIFDLIPEKEKLFSNDVFIFSENNSIKIIHSSTRINENIPAVLILADQKTYGRKKSTNKQKSRLLYKCIPDDTRIPTFLVPYEIKDLGFTKVLQNYYVTIKFDNWDEIHPHGQLTQTIGPVNILDNFYEYQLYCKSLNASIQKFNKDTNKALQEKTSLQEKTGNNINSHNDFIYNVFQKNKNIEDRTNTDWKIITIDPPKSLDYDDGFSIKKLNDNESLISIYIANVTILLDTLNLWSSFSRRISTIYLPDRRRPMLPTILSDCLCSLQEGFNRFAFTMDIVVDVTSSKIVSTKFTNTMIKVHKNYTYENPNLLVDSSYKMLLDICKGLSTNYKYISKVRNSHELVCYLMILMNFHCAKNLFEFKNGIFRSTIVKKVVSVPDYLPDDVSQFIKIWNSACGQYMNIEHLDDGQREILTKHQLLEVDAYIHITSPIRRLVDLLNIIKFQQNNNMLQLSGEAQIFYDKWINDIEYINITMRAIRKVQNDCNLLDTCYNDPQILEKEYDGYCFDKLTRNDGLYHFIIYLPELRLASRITMRENLEEYEKRKYKLYLFSNEDNFKKKIRLQVI